MAVWAFLDKQETYLSMKPQKGKEGKPPDAWNLHLSFDEMTFTEQDGMFTLMCNATSSTGHSVMKDQQDKIKFPKPVKVQFKTEGATVGERCLMRVMKLKCEPGKYYSGFVSINDDNPFALAIADGKKADGSEMSEADIANMSGQFIGVMEATQSKLTAELMGEMQKAKSGGGYNRGGGGESLADKIATRETKLRTYLKLPADAAMDAVVAEYAVVTASSPAMAEVIKLLLS